MADLGKVQQPIRIIICGKSADIARNVKALLKPEVEVLHVVFSVQDFIYSAVPLLSQSPAFPSEHIKSTTGTSERVQAVVTGAGYDDEAFAQMRDAAEKAGGEQVPWLKPNLERSDIPPLGPGYAEFVVKYVKECLRELQLSGDLDGGQNRKGHGVYFY